MVSPSILALNLDTLTSKPYLASRPADTANLEYGALTFFFLIHLFLSQVVYHWL
jgi:hypothetical protein